MPNNKPEKKLIWAWVGGNLVVLVPKQRGSGFLKTPYWHKVNPALEDIRWQLGDVDIHGLDGHLEIVVSRSVRSICTDEDFAAKAMSLLEAHYGFPSEESSKDFFANHPVPSWEGHEGFFG